ncbi:DNA repair protein RadC [Paenibacillus sp. YN15]|uniref:RadC family protein n=1 Tax=Paenibacillus sp. YN15 TaxID=1742774 RepID=UPI0026D6D20B
MYPPEALKHLVSESLREQANSYTIEELFQHFPTSNALLDASEQQLTLIKGIGKGKARQLSAIMKLAKLLMLPCQPPSVIRSPQDVYSLLEPELRYEQKEHFIGLFLNTKNHVIFKEVISIGSLNATVVHPREVFHAAIKHCSASLICVHNHPSGDTTPSSEDVELTKR